MWHLNVLEPTTSPATNSVKSIIKREDLWGFFDVLCLYPDRTGVTGVQCCARSGHAEHRKKILENDIAPEFLRVGNVIEIWSWGKQKLRRGGKAERWMPKIEILVLKDFEK